MTTLALLPLLLFGLSVWAFVMRLGVAVYLSFFGLCAVALALFVNVMEKLRLSAALIGCASKALRGQVLSTPFDHFWTLYSVDARVDRGGTIDPRLSPV